ncbi:hypothetical protein BVX95_00085 [archaeon D22]|nr:hypothetical protein BVX95_00085 [archaeon D22]
MKEAQILKKLGFTEYETRAYLSLAKLGTSTVREIIEDSKLPRNKAYESLQNLEAKGKIVLVPVSPKKYKIVNPEVFNDEIDSMRKEVDSLIKLIEKPKINKHEEFFWIIKGKKEIHNYFAAENSKIEKELLICHTISNSYFKNIKSIKQCIDRGVKVKILTPHNQKLSETYNLLKNMGIEIRTYDEKKYGTLQRISIFDNNSASIVIGSPEVKSHEDYVMLWTESRIFSNMLKSYFLSIWNSIK